MMPSQNKTNNMRKTKWYILVGISLVLLVSGLAVFLINPAKAETTSTTFPVDEAGIAAYVKVDNIEDFDLDALAEAYHTVEKQGESYVIGKVRVPNYVAFNYPNVYVGMDGWIVAYYLKTEEASRIMQWDGYVAGSINTTTLRDALDIISQESGLTYSTTSIKYYDFEFPEANKMTLVAEEGTNNFYITVPGTLYEASYNVSLRARCGGGSRFQYLRLKLDEALISESAGGGGWSYWQPFSSYGYYGLSIFVTNITHQVVFHSASCGNSASYATVLIYKN